MSCTVCAAAVYGYSKPYDTSAIKICTCAFAWARCSVDFWFLMWSSPKLLFVIFFLFSSFFCTAVTLDTVADESRKKMADGVARSPFRFCSWDGKICCYGDVFSTIFLRACFCALLPTFRFLFFFFSLYPCVFIFFVSLRLCSSHLLLSASTYFMVRVLSACVICTLRPHLGILLFFYSSEASL